MLEAKVNADEQQRDQTETRLSEAKHKADEKNWKAVQATSTAQNSLNMNDMKGIMGRHKAGDSPITPKISELRLQFKSLRNHFRYCLESL